MTNEELERAIDFPLKSRATAEQTAGTDRRSGALIKVVEEERKGGR